MQASSQGIHSGSVVRSIWFSPLFFFLCHQIYALFYVNNYCPVGKSVKKITSNGKRSRKPFKWGKWFSYSKWSDIGNDQIQWKEFSTAALRREQQHVHETPIRRDIKEDERESENEWACESVGVRTVVGSVRNGRIEMKYNVDGKKESTIHNWKKARHGVMLCRQTFILLRQKPFTALFFLPHSIFRWIVFDEIFLLRAFSTASIQTGCIQIFLLSLPPLLSSNSLSAVVYFTPSKTDKSLAQKNNRMGKNALVVWYGCWALNESFACSTLLYRGYFVSDLWMLMSFPFNRHHSTIHSYSFSCFSRLITAKMRIWWLFSISISLFLILVYFSWRDFITHSMVFNVLSFGMRMYSKHRHISSNEKGCSHAKRQPHYTHTYIRRAIGVCMLCKARKWTISLAITKYLERKLNLISRLFHIPNIIAIERSLCW